MTSSSSFGPRSVHRTLVVALAAGVFGAACKQDTIINSACENNRFDMFRPTQGKMLAFLLQPQTISYQYREVQPQDTTRLLWDSSQIYYGVACLRFQTRDSVRIDTAGVFQFLMAGSNAGTVWQTYRGQTDSLSASLFFGCEGDGGTYRVASNNTVQYSWRNGEQYRLFGPAAVHTLVGDTIWVTAEESYRADSTHASWRAAWVRGSCGE